jgi:formate--tetrahydrofolate ligase
MTRGEALPRPIVEVARDAGLGADDLDLYGRFKAKLRPEVGRRLADRPRGRYVVVTGVTPTPLGEGKTVVAIGLAQALHRAGRRAVVCLRQPSLGPALGLKGGGAGGGAARLLPFDDVNLHLTGDTHAVGTAHNLLAAALDAHLFRGNALGIDPHTITLKRVLDVDDRALRHVVLGLGGREDGVPRQSGFEITAASEVMAILALASGPDDLRARLGRIVVGYTRDGALVTAEDLKGAGAMAVLLKDALLPNLVQTAEHTPAFVHGGPFGNIAHGNSSVAADAIALALADVVVTESGFGADLGLEKFADIKCRASGLAPDGVVLVATVRALKRHGGHGDAVAHVGPGEPGMLPPPPAVEGDLRALERGCANLDKQIENARLLGVPVVVAVNRFPTDSAAEVALVRRRAIAAGAAGAAETTVWADGGAGGLELAAAVAEACQRPGRFRPLYPGDLPLREKIETIAGRVYGAAGVDYDPAAQQALAHLTALGHGGLPVCLAKTHLSLSHDPARLGAPTGFRLPVRDVRLAAGAGFVTALCGAVSTMPGLPSHPAYERLDLVDGRVVGLA